MPGKISIIPRVPLPTAPKRTAAYARVSSGKDAMLHSLSAQVSHYSGLIRGHGGWEYAGVYADEALTGTKDSREAFQRLLSDCRAGKIDLVITKSISRFARNTVTLLRTVRELKALGVDVWFEEQNIHTLSADGELMLTILASYAQAESLSASENQKWRIRRGFEKGELINLRAMFGYRISKDGVETDEETAPVVREIFSRVIAGESFSSIAADLNARGVRGALGGMLCSQSIRRICANEKYTGNAMLQKRFRSNHLDKKLLVNSGELPRFYAEGTHPAIIDQTTFSAAQEVLLRMEKAAEGRSHPKTSEFTGRIICPLCGKPYRRVLSNGTPGWNCSTYIAKGKACCHGKKIPEEKLKDACAGALGLSVYDPEVFSARIERIEVPGDNRLRFVFRDGSEAERGWTDRSRSESWTPEMRRAAAERRRAQCRK